MSSGPSPFSGLEPRRLARGFLRGNLSLAASYALSVAASVVLARGLTPDSFGVLAFATALATYAGLLSRWGTEISLVRDMVRAQAGRETALHDALALRMRLALLSVLAIVAPSWLAFPPLKAAVVTGMVLGQLVLVFDLGPIYDMEGRTSRHLLFSAVRHGLYVALAFACVSLVPGTLPVLAVSLAWVLTNVAFVIHCWRDMRVPARLVSQAVARGGALELARRNLAAFLSLFAHQCYVNLDLILISLWLGDRVLGPYAVASALAQAALGSTGLLHRLLQRPLVDGLRNARGPATYRRCLAIAGAVSLLLGLGLLSAGPPVVRVLYPAYMAEAGVLAQFLSAWVCLGGVGGVAAYALLGLGRDRAYLFSVLAGAVTNFALNVLLIPRYGVWGAAWTTVASQALATGLALGASRDILLGPEPVDRGAGPPVRADASAIEAAHD